MTITEFCEKAVRDPRFQEESGKTYCNLFVQAVMSHVGCQGFGGLLANDVLSRIEKANDWRKLDPDEAWRTANDGELVIAGCKNPSGHGHLCVVIAGPLTWSKSHGDDVPMVANVGPAKYTFFGRPASYAFSAKNKPSYWLWLKSAGGGTK